MNYDSAVGVVMAVEYQSRRLSVRTAGRRRKFRHHGLHKRVYALTGFCRNADRIVRVKPKLLLYLFLYGWNIGGSKVYLVDYRDNRQILLKCHVHIAYGLTLDTLRSVNKKQRPLAGGYRPGNLIGKINVTRRIDKIQLIVVSIGRPVWNCNRLAFYCYSPLTFYVHIVKNLIHHLALINNLGLLNKPVGQSGLSVVDVRHNTEISLVLHVCHKSVLQTAKTFQKRNARRKIF